MKQLLPLGAICATLAVLASPSPAQVVAPSQPAWRLSSATLGRLDEVVDAPASSSARIGVAVRLLGRASSPSQFPSAPLPSGPQVLYERDAAKRFLPASNMKMFTVANALKYLGAGFRVQTRLLAKGKQDGSTWSGDLVLVGGGDPMLTSRDIERMAQEAVLALKKRGVSRVAGRVVGDGSALKAETFGGRYPDTWALDDALWYYGPPISALCVDRNQVDVSLAPTRPGQTPRLTTSGPPGFPIANRTRTVAAKRPQTVTLDRADASSPLSNTLTIAGDLPLGAAFTEGVAVPDPPQRAAYLLKSALASRGLSVSGGAVSGKSDGAQAVELSSHQSPTLREMAAFCLKPSDNLSAEVILRLTALHAGSAPRAATAARAHSMLRGWLGAASPEVREARFVDGSGLGRYNMISPRLTLDLLQAVEALPATEGRAFWDGLPLAGADGTLRRRMKGTAAEKNARAKTGSFAIASSLSGYVTTRDGFRLAASFLSNFGSTSAMREAQDKVFTALAEATLEPSGPA